MTAPARLALLGGSLGVAVLAAALTPPVRQDPAYHRMADGRVVAGIPNGLNVLSNLPFVLVGAAGLWGLSRREGAGGAVRFVEAGERWPYRVLFAGLLLTGLGSAYYHLETGNARLVWDRLPLAVTLMGLLAAAVAERISVRTALFLLGPLVAAGIVSVFWWYAGERRGEGDLRLYGLVQFYPLLAIPLLVLLFRSRYTRSGDLLAAGACYGLGKLCEILDTRIFALGGVVSGHTLKHIAAALSGYWIWRMLITRQPA